ncbi:MFS transporter [Segetibacter aerophilus]|uniref:Major facilitator transporter n=1 Tax=Segetibacter aerophilus TaxID=670293 RepID=A0A512B7A8_9BACT|nr:MFS transporter [Segetibacter aerophilus]GEO07840.1 major facilitator transporter [Segetibacter aerophilus]
MQETKEKAGLTSLHLWVMTIATGLVVANIYYNQPLLADISKDFNVSEAEGGILAMLTQVGYAAGMLFCVPLGDMLKRKQLIMAVFVIDIIALLLAAWSPTIHILMLASFLIGAFSIIPQLIIPMAAHLSLPERRGKTIGFVMSGLLIGILLSRTVSGYVGAHLGWRAMFWIAAGLMVILAASLYFLLPEVYPEYKGNYKQLMTSLISITKEEPILRIAAIRGALCFAGFAGFWSTLAFLLRQPQFNAGSEVAGAFGLVGAFGALAASQMGKFSDRGNGHQLIAISIGIVIVSFIIFGFSGSSIAGLIIGVILMDMGVQGAHISNQAAIFSIRPEARNRMNTVYMVTYFIGGALGTLLATQAWEIYHWKGVVAMGLVVSVIALLIHWYYRPAVVVSEPVV